MAHRVALFAGSFDPYTNGHHEIVTKASRLFDELVILIGVNVAKRRAFDAQSMCQAIQQALDGDGLNARAVVFEGLVTDYCRKHGIRWYFRGLRGESDYSYEENNARVNCLLCPEVETIYLRSKSPALSSGMIRELMAFGRDVSEFVPEPVRQLLNSHSGE